MVNTWRNNARTFEILRDIFWSFQSFFTMSLLIFFAFTDLPVATWRYFHLNQKNRKLHLIYLPVFPLISCCKKSSSIAQLKFMWFSKITMMTTTKPLSQWWLFLQSPWTFTYPPDVCTNTFCIQYVGIQTNMIYVTYYKFSSGGTTIDLHQNDSNHMQSNCTDIMTLGDYSTTIFKFL